MKLPAPNDRPSADVVIYDGHCRFCTQGVRRLHKMDVTGRLCFLSLHDEATKEICPELSHEQMMEEMWVIDRQRGKRYGGAAAGRYLSRILPSMWPAAPLLHIPFSLPMWKWLYRQVARRRYQFMGKTEECDSGVCDAHFR